MLQCRRRRRARLHERCHRGISARGRSSPAPPAISTGVFGFPLGRAADVILESIVTYLRSHPESLLQEIRLTMIHQDTVEAFRDALARTWAPRPAA